MAPTPKPWYRPRNVVLALLLLLVAWLGLETYRALTAKPGNPVDYSAKLNELVKSYQPAAGVNGWDDWMTALQTLSARLDEMQQRYQNAPPGTPNSQYSWPYDFAAIGDDAASEDVLGNTREIMDQVRADGLLDQLALAAAHERAQRIIPNSARLMEIMLPELGVFRMLARYNAARMRRAAAAGDWDDYALAFDEGIRSAHVLTHQGTLIDHLVGYAVAQLMLSELSTTLATNQPDVAALQRLAASLDRSPLGPLELALRSERIFSLDTIQWTHTDNGHGNGRLIVSGTSILQSGGGPALPSYKIFNVLGLVLPSKKQTTAKLDEYYDRTIDWANMTVAQRNTSSFQPTQWITAQPYGYVILKLIVPPIDRTVQARDRTLSEYTRARIAIALDRFRADRGEYPASLDELVPAYLDDVPLDPATGDPFTYERAPEEGPALGPYHLGAPAAEAAETSDPTSTP